MKKLLALVLALVMTLGLATVGANAAYKDADDINYEEAVDVMSAIGILAGDESGFRPADTLKRSEGAKIVAYLIAGNKTAEAMQGTGNKFTDLPANHWAAGYMEYLASVGVMGGIGDGKIDPDGQLTATAFGKMLLTALGYDAEIEGFGGPDWSINVQRVANKVGIYDGNDDVVGSAAVTREEAAQYAFNTIKAPLVEYDTKISVNVQGADVTVGNSNAKYKTNNSLAKNTISTKRTIDGSYIAEFAEEYYSGLKLTPTGDGFGRSANNWNYKGTDVGTYTDKSDLVATYTAKAKKGDLYDLFGSTIINGIANGNTVLSVFVDGQRVANPVTANYFDKNSSAAAGQGVAGSRSGNGVLTEVYKTVDSDGTVYIGIIMINTYLVKATADYNTNKDQLPIESIEINAASPKVPAGLPNAIAGDDFPEVKDFKEDDYLLITWSTTDNSIGTVEKAQILTGVVSKYTEETNVVIDGETKSYNDLVGAGDEHEKGVVYTINENAKVVLDSYGYIIRVDEAVATGSFVFIAETDTKSQLLSSKFIANAYFLDGTAKEVVLGKVDAKTVIDDDNLHDTDTATRIDYQVVANQWYTYIVDSNGEYVLRSVDDNQTNDNNASNNTGDDRNFITNSTVRFIVNAANGRTSIGSAGTRYIVRDQVGDVSTYVGVTSVPTVIIADGTAADQVKAYWTYSPEGFAKLVFIDAFGADEDQVEIEDPNNSADYLFLLHPTDNYTVLEGTRYLEYKVVLDGEETTKYVEATLASQMEGQLYTNLKENSKGYITKGTAFTTNGSGTKVKTTLTGNAASVIGQSNNTLALGTGDAYIVNSDTKIYVGIDNDAQALLKDRGATYELHSAVSANYVNGLLKDYRLTGFVYAALKTDTQVANAIYIWVSNATTTNGGVVVTPGTDATLEAVDITGANTVTYRYYGATSPSQAAIANDLAEYMGEDVYSYNKATGRLVMDRSGAYTVTLTRVAAVKANGVIVDYIDLDTDTSNLANASATVPTGNYLLKGTTHKNASDLTATSNTASIAADVTNDGADIEYVSAYTVTGSSGITGVYLATDTTHSNNYSGHYFPTDASLDLVGTATNGKVQLLVGGTPTGTLAATNDGTARVYSYTVGTANAAVTESTPVYDVYFVTAAGATEKVSLGDGQAANVNVIYANGNANAKYATFEHMTDVSGVSANTDGANRINPETGSAGNVVIYKIDNDHAAAGVIKLVQLVEVQVGTAGTLSNTNANLTIAATNGTYGASAENVGHGGFVPAGTALAIAVSGTGTEGKDVQFKHNDDATYANLNPVVQLNASHAASTSYTTLATDYLVAWDVETE